MTSRVFGVPADRPRPRTPDRSPRPAAVLRVGDYLHDPLVPLVVAAFEDAGGERVDQPPAGHTVTVIGTLASGTEMTVRYGAGHRIDTTRMVPTSAPTSAAGRRHLTLVYSAARVDAR